jgi:DNA-binding MarR family transcriptional regulator
MKQPGASPGFLLWHATLRWQRALADALAPLDLTHVQFVLLACAWWLNHQGDHPSQVELAGFAGTDVKMTSQVVRSLERKGLIERRTDASDARAFRIHVTPRGSRLAPRAIDGVESVDASFFGGVRETDAVRLLRDLAGVAATPAATR